MKCPKCKSEIKDYENDSFCSKCGFPVNAPVDDGKRKLQTIYFDAELKALYVNGIRMDRVNTFTLNCDTDKCSLLISKDELLEG